MTKLRTLKTAVEFLEMAEPDLEKNEVVNNLLLGIVYSLIENPRQYRSDPFYAIVENKGLFELFALMTPPYKPILYASHDAVEDACKELAKHFASQKMEIPGVIGPQKAARTFVNVYSAITDCAVNLSMSMRIYKLTRVIEPQKPKGIFRPAEEKDVPILKKWIDAFHIDVFKELKEDVKEDPSLLIRNSDLYVWDDNGIVSMVHKTRPTKHGYAITLVYTPPLLRNKGYASAVVAALCGYILTGGKTFCSLFTDLSNQTSNSIYQKIGFKPVCDFYDFTFEGRKG